MNESAQRNLSRLAIDEPALVPELVHPPHQPLSVTANPGLALRDPGLDMMHRVIGPERHAIHILRHNGKGGVTRNSEAVEGERQAIPLLHAVENGTVTLIGATTENPSFEDTGALLSRCRVLVLNQLSEDEIKMVLRNALADDKRGLAAFNPSISEQLLDRIAHSAAGDARVALTALDAAVESTALDSSGFREVTEQTVIEA